MSGRFTLTRTAEELVDAFGLVDLPEEWRPRYNIAPTQPVLIVAGQDPTVARWARWGLIPAWARDPQVGARTINARAETLDEKPSFEAPFREKRCLVLADGFYEWRKTAAGKQPVYFRLRGHRPFAFAGLWDLWRAPDGVAVQSCTIVTTRANDDVAGVHDRMPVILDEAERDLWISPGASPRELRRLLSPLAAGRLVFYGVGTLVNSPANDAPRCIAPAQLDLELR